METHEHQELSVSMSDAPGLPLEHLGEVLLAHYRGQLDEESRQCVQELLLSDPRWKAHHDSIKYLDLERAAAIQDSVDLADFEPICGFCDVLYHEHQGDLDQLIAARSAFDESAEEAESRWDDHLRDCAFCRRLVRQFLSKRQREAVELDEPLLRDALLRDYLDKPFAEAAKRIPELAPADATTTRTVISIEPGPATHSLEKWSVIYRFDHTAVCQDNLCTLSVSDRVTVDRRTRASYADDVYRIEFFQAPYRRAMHENRPLRAALGADEQPDDETRWTSVICHRVLPDQVGELTLEFQAANGRVSCIPKLEIAQEQDRHRYELHPHLDVPLPAIVDSRLHSGVPAKIDLGPVRDWIGCQANLVVRIVRDQKVWLVIDVESKDVTGG